jgi:hypothetical protein
MIRVRTSIASPWCYRSSRINGLVTGVAQLMFEGIEDGQCTIF